MLVASLAYRLSVERHLSVTHVLVDNTTDSVEDDDVLIVLGTAYVATDHQLTAVRARSAWPTMRPGDPVHLALLPGNQTYLNCVLYPQPMFDCG